MKCGLCGRNGFFYLRYSGHHLCKKHFIQMFEKRVKKGIRQNRLIDSEDHVLVGLSGGKDSMSALKILNDITCKIPSARLSALTVDEGIGGRNLEKARQYCESIGVEHHTVCFRDYYGFDIDGVLGKRKADGVLACSICGVLKRNLMNEWAGRHGATKVATGHNLDDEIQSAFMNIMRGDLPRLGRLGALVGSGAHEGFVPRIKILRECPEDEVRQYARALGLPHTNKCCPYAKTSLRTTVKEMLDGLEGSHPGSKYQMLRSVDSLCAIMRERHVGQAPGVCGRCGAPTANRVCKACLILERLKVVP
jgi:uncharacterized protein (TIGR00269 family)